MGTRSFRYGAQGPRRIVVSWNEPLFTDTKLALDQVEIGRIATRAEFERGRSWRLSDGSTLELQLAQASPSGVEVRLDGTLLEGRCENAARLRRRAVIFAALAAFGHLVMAGGTVMLLRSDPRQLSVWQDSLFLVCAPLGLAYTILAVGAARASVPALLALALLGTIEVAFCLLPFLAQGVLGNEEDVWGDGFSEFAFFPLPLLSRAGQGMFQNPWVVRALVAIAGAALALVPIRAWYATRADRPRSPVA